MSKRDHWDGIYRRKGPGEVSWYRPHLERSLGFLDRAGLTTNASILDVGGGTSTLVDDLLRRGFTCVAVLDLSQAAIDQAKARLGSAADRVEWIAGDVIDVELPEHAYDFWHDRAVFHFLVDEEARRRYVTQVRRALKPNGHIVVATFGPEGPEKCSGLPVMRYSADGIHDQFGNEFRKIGSEHEVHKTPWGAEQEFVYCYCRMPA